VFVVNLRESSFKRPPPPFKLHRVHALPAFPPRPRIAHLAPSIEAAAIARTEHNPAYVITPFKPKNSPSVARCIMANT
jgi:hypothetical protein